MTIRQELLQFIWLNQEDQFVPTHIALGQLHERFADALISGLMECLTDEEPEVRLIAVELLIEAKANVAVPALIERLGDGDRLVQIAVLTGIGSFGRLAVDAIHHLHPWLDSEDEYLRILAAIAVISIDEYRTELLPVIRAALKSDNPAVRSLALDFFAKTNATMPFDEAAFQESVRANWNYHSPSEEIEWRCDLQDDGTWGITVSPVYQQIWAGENDGKKVWAGFDFHAFGFTHEPGVEVLDFGAMSYCFDHNPMPFMGFKGRYFGQPFLLRIQLEPTVDSVIREVVDTVTKQVRPYDSDDDE